MSDLVIVAAQRTPIGSFQGQLSGLAASDLGAHAIKAALAHAALDPAHIAEVLMGNVLSAGQGQAPARQAALKAGLAPSTPCTTVNKVCGSGLKTVMLAADQIRLNPDQVLIAGGMESMTNAPYLLDRARGGYRYGHGQIFDHMALDGLEDAYEHVPMGQYAEATAAKYALDRAAQDAFAIESLRRATTGHATGAFAAEITPITIKQGKEDVTMDKDEQPFKVKPEKIPTLKPAFQKDGTVTAASSSSISDGAAAVIITSAARAKALGLTPIARVLGYTSHAHDPKWFTTAPVGAVQALCTQLNQPLSAIDLLEVNEAFAVVPMAFMKETGLDHDRINVHGGACALGHPIGASGARVLVTLIHALRHHKKRLGIAALCIGGGEGVAMAVEVA